MKRIIFFFQVREEKNFDVGTVHTGLRSNKTSCGWCGGGEDGFSSSDEKNQHSYQNWKGRSPLRERTPLRTS